MSADYPTPLDAYWGFFDTFNARDAEAWAGVMSYPHVRVSPRGESRVFATPAEYAGNASWTRIVASGWVRTQGKEPVVLHASANKAHLAGGWTRVDSSGEAILVNQVTYVITRVGDRWGIQARFAVDERPGAAETGAAAVDVVARYLATASAGDVAAASALCHFPLVDVGVGEVGRLADASSGFSAAAVAGAPRAVQLGDGAVNVAVGEGTAGALYLVTNQAGRWGIQGRSFVG